MFTNVYVPLPQMRFNYLEYVLNFGIFKRFSNNSKLQTSLGTTI